MNDIASQYRITADGAGWAAQSQRGRLRFDGRDRMSFLHALVSNDVERLEPGAGVYAVYLTPQGRMLADLRLYNRGEFLIADVPATEAGPLAARFDGLIFSEDVRVTDVSTEIRQFTIAGARAADAIARAFELESDAVQALPLLSQLDAPGVFVARTDDAECPSFDVFIESRPDVISSLEAAGAVAVSEDLFEVLRIEAGHPAFGRDMTSETIPLEAGLLERAISTTKGCYVGQEVIIRVLHRGGGRVVKRLVRLSFETGLDVSPVPGVRLFVDSRDTGQLTSVAFSPSRGRFIALGYVHRDAAEIGRHVTVGSGNGIAAEIVGFAA
ncbi:MAG: YgfZ/GcvT domain-containing protein [Acidobacteriota bacterium]